MPRESTGEPPGVTGLWPLRAGSPQFLRSHENGWPPELIGRLNGKGGPRPRFFNLPECSWSASIFFRLATLIPKLSSDPALVPGNPEKSRTSRSEISRIFRFAKIRHANDFVICDSLVTLPGRFAEMSRIPTVLRAFFFSEKWQVEGSLSLPCPSP